MTKDYYRILGVLDDAEDVVIRAAYKALAQRYHPDKWTGDKEEANRRMQEINEAYGVLSDSAKRKQYDATRDSGEYTESSDTYEEDFNYSIEETWKEISRYFPDLIEITKNLSRISNQLSYSYKVLLIEHKKFNEREQIAQLLEKRFLEKYFGTNKKILEFAKKLIYQRKKEAAKEVNKAVRLLGSEIDPNIIISSVKEKFVLNDDVFMKNVPKTQSQLRKESAQAFLRNKSLRNAIIFINDMDGKLSNSSGVFSDKYEVLINDKKYEHTESSLLEFVTKLTNDFLNEN